jgi:hypothetical protein
LQKNFNQTQIELGCVPKPTVKIVAKRGTVLPAPTAVRVPTRIIPGLITTKHLRRRLQTNILEADNDLSEEEECVLTKQVTYVEACHGQRVVTLCVNSYLRQRMLAGQKLPTKVAVIKHCLARFIPIEEDEETKETVPLIKNTSNQKGRMI